LDGDGSIMLYRHWDRHRGRHYYIIKVRFFNSYLEVLEWVQAKVGGGSLCPIPNYNYPNQFRTQKMRYLLDFGRRLAVPLLKRILPYLIVKRRQAEVVLDFHEKTKRKMNYVRKWKCFYGARPLNEYEIKLREEYYKKIRELNR